MSRPLIGDAFGPRSRASRRACFAVIGLTASIAIALGGCNRADADRPEPGQGAYVYLAAGDFGRLKKLCDHGRAVYWVDSSYRGSAIAVASDAPECASGTEARSGETERLDPKGDGPTGEAGDARKALP